MDQRSHSLLILLPAFNESEVIGGVIKNIISQGYENILVVDDNSEDNTATIASECGAEVIKLPYNMGAWKATQTGMRYALKKGFSTVVTMDADGQHNPQEIKKLLKKREGGTDLVIGSCTARGSRGRHLAWRMLRLISQLEIDDLTSGFRCYSRPAVCVLSGRRATLLDYQDIGVLFLIKHSGLSYSEVNVAMKPRKNGISRIFYSWAAVCSYLAYTLILTTTKALPFAMKKYRLKVLEEGRSE